MIAAVGINLGMLGFFKYAGFFIENINALSGLKLTAPEIILPIGISFYTFQALSYVVDAYRCQVPIQRSYRDFLLYVALFPQLIAGPIVRYSEIEPQLTHRRQSLTGIYYGVTRFCMGLAKKVLIANYAGKLSSQLLDGNLEQLTTVGGWLGIIFFSFMIYFDFSGYSDMAIGLGRIFGFRYAENFNLPYISKSITEFWRRWHISLGSFFRDYVYIPMGGNRRHQVLNLFVVWGLTGMWHGASWNFILWGLYFFVIIYIEKHTKKTLDKVPKAIRHITTLFLIMLGWTLFYCTDFTRLGQTLGVLFGQFGAGLYSGQNGIMLLNSLPLLLVCIIGSTAIPRTIGMVFTALFAENRGKSQKRKVYVIIVFIFNMALLALCTVSLVGSTYNPFLYFRF